MQCVTSEGLVQACSFSFSDLFLAKLQFYKRFYIYLSHNMFRSLASCSRGGFRRTCGMFNSENTKELYHCIDMMPFWFAVSDRKTKDFYPFDKLKRFIAAETLPWWHIWEVLQSHWQQKCYCQFWEDCTGPKSYSHYFGLASWKNPFFGYSNVNQQSKCWEKLLNFWSPNIGHRV